MPQPHARTLLVNPPPVNGIAFTRQGRCQEREEVLGTTKPPYTLALAATLLQARGSTFRLVDQTAERLSTGALIDRLDRERFQPDRVIFCSTTPTLAADAEEMAVLRRRFGAALFAFGPQASTVPRASMERAPDVDGMLVGEPEEGIVALADGDLSPAHLGSVASLTWRHDGVIEPHRAPGVYQDFARSPFPSWSLLPLDRYVVPLEGQPYVLVETSRGCPYTCDFCVAPLHQGHRFRERDPGHLVDEMERARRELGIRHFYLWGDTVTLNVRTVGRLCEELINRRLDVRWFGNARADNLTDPAFVALLGASGCWMLSMGIESSSDEVRQSMEKRLELEKARTAIRNLRAAGIRSFAFFIYGYPGETIASMERTTRCALELDPDFANFYPAVPYPGTALYEKCVRDGLLADEDWERMESWYYLLRAGELDEASVMGAIARARRRFALRPRYLARHAVDFGRLMVRSPRMGAQVLGRTVWSVPAPRPPWRAPHAPDKAGVQP